MFLFTFITDSVFFWFCFTLLFGLPLPLVLCLNGEDRIPLLQWSWGAAFIVSCFGLWNSYGNAMDDRGQEDVYIREFLSEELGRVEGEAYAISNCHIVIGGQECSRTDLSLELNTKYGHWLVEKDR